MTGKVVMLGSGFCVLLAVIALKKMGVLSAAFINKIRYWPQYVKGEEIKAYFCQRLPGEINGAKFDIF